MRIVGMVVAIGAFLLSSCEKKQSESNPVSPNGSEKIIPSEKPPDDLNKATPDYTFTAEAFHKELEGETRENEKKYRGKVIELSGEVASVFRDAAGQAKLSFKIPGALIGLSVMTADDQPWLKVVPGQKVKLKGKLPTAPINAALTACVFVETGEYQGILLTASDLAKECATNPEEAEKKFKGKYVIVTGEVEQVNASAATIDLRTGQKVKLILVFTVNDTIQTKPVKAGQKIKVLGKFSLIGASVIMMDCTIFKNP